MLGLPGTLFQPRIQTNMLPRSNTIFKMCLITRECMLFFSAGPCISSHHKNSLHCWWVFLVNKHYLREYSSLLRQIWTSVTECYLWGMLQGGVYRNNHHNNHDAKKFLNTVSVITPVELRRTINRVFVACRCDWCLRYVENNFQSSLWIWSVKTWHKIDVSNQNFWTYF